MRHAGVVDAFLLSTVIFMRVTTTLRGYIVTVVLTFYCSVTQQFYSVISEDKLLDIKKVN